MRISYDFDHDFDVLKTWPKLPVIFSIDAMVAKYCGAFAAKTISYLSVIFSIDAMVAKYCGAFAAKTISYLLNLVN